MPTTDTKPLYQIVNIDEEIVKEADVRMEYRQGGYDPRNKNRYLAHVSLHRFFDRNDVALYWMGDSDYVEYASRRPDFEDLNDSVPAYDL